MNEYEIALTIIAVIIFITVFVFMRIIFYYKNKYFDINYENDKKNEKIIELRELVDNLQDAITFLEEKLKEPEKVVMSPKEITCKFEISDRLSLVDAECIKRHAFYALVDYMIREYDNDSTLFNIQQTKNPISDSINFKLGVRLLPYPEQSDNLKQCVKKWRNNYERFY